MTQVRMYSLYIVQTLYNMVEMRSASKQERERERGIAAARREF